MIFDECHHISELKIQDIFLKFLNKYSNIYCLLLTATPMKNLADNIVDIINIMLCVEKKTLI